MNFDLNRFPRNWIVSRSHFVNRIRMLVDDDGKNTLSTTSSLATWMAKSENTKRVMVCSQLRRRHRGTGIIQTHNSPTIAHADGKACHPHLYHPQLQTYIELWTKTVEKQAPNGKKKNYQKTKFIDWSKYTQLMEKLFVFIGRCVFCGRSNILEVIEDTDGR